MDLNTNKSLARRYLEMWNMVDERLINELIAPEASGHASGQSFHGHAALRQRMESYKKMYRTARFTLEDLIAEGDRVAARWSFQGTASGEGASPQAEGKEISVTGMNIFRFVDGKIAEIWVNSDDLGEMRQMGLISH